MVYQLIKKADNSNNFYSLTFFIAKSSGQKKKDQQKYEYLNFAKVSIYLPYAQIQKNDTVKAL